MKAIATYQRVSKVEQSKDTDAFIRQGWQLDRKAADFLDRDRLVFSDIQSGRRDDRPDMLKLIAAIEAGKIDTLIVTRIDRIGRDLEANARLQKQLERKKVVVFEILLGRFLDWDNPNDWDYFVKSGLDGEKESRTLSRRVKQTFEWHRSQGKMGGGRVGFPYRRNDEGFIEPDPQQWELAIDCIQILIKSDGATMGALDQIRGLGLDRTRVWLSNWIRSPLLRGHTPQWTRLENGNRKPIGQIGFVPNTHLSLFTDPRLKGCEKQLDRIISDSRRLKGLTKTRPTYPLSGLIYCGRCGNSCQIKTISNSKYPDKKYTYVMCGARANRGIACGGEYGAFKGQRGTINTVYQLVEAAVISKLTSKAAELVDLTIADRSTSKPENPAIIDLQRNIDRLKSLNDPDLDGAIAKKTAQLNTLKLTSCDLPISADARREFVELFSKPDVFLSLSDREKRVLYRDWVQKITVNLTDISVVLTV